MASLLTRHGRGVALLIVAAGLAVRVPGIMEWWLNPDEGIYFSILTQPTLAAFWAEVSENAHPPLYYLILRAVGFFTTDFFWYRVVSLVSAAAALFALWECGREIAWEDPTRRTVTGWAAAALLVPSPLGIVLSQTMRPYMLQLMLVAGALAMLLRYGREPDRRTLMGYVGLLALALLTHYSSVLALGALGGVALYLLVTAELPHAARRALVLAHMGPALLVLGLYVFHLRGLSGSGTADDALQGWLSFYLVGSPREAWLAFLGLQSVVWGRDLGGPVAILTLAALLASVVGRAWLPVVVAGSALTVGLVAAAAGVYPMGATRHSIWMLSFTVPALAWAVGLVATSGKRWALAGLTVGVVLAIAREQVSTLVGLYESPWAAPERVLKQADLTGVLDLVDPAGAPRLVVMDLQTYYLLVPFFFAERSEAEPGPEDTFFHFRYGEREVVVAQSWLLTAGAEGASEKSNLRSLAKGLEAAGLSVVPPLQAQVLVGGWRTEVVDHLFALQDSGVVTHHRLVPGLFAFLVDLERLEGPD